MITRNELREQLQNFNCTVSFTKTDGTRRDMLCTLREAVLPKREEISKTKRGENLEILSVWDLEKEAWRSFRIKSILGVDVN